MERANSHKLSSDHRIGAEAHTAPSHPYVIKTYEKVFLYHNRIKMLKDKVIAWWSPWHENVKKHPAATPSSGIMMECLFKIHIGRSEEKVGV